MGTKPQTLFTKDYWVTETNMFCSRMRVPGLSEDEVVKLVSGLCHLRSVMYAECPEHEDFFKTVFRDCHLLVKVVMGDEWVRRHMDVIDRHGGFQIQASLGSSLGRAAVS